MNPETTRLFELAMKLDPGERAELARRIEPTSPVLTVQPGDIISVVADGLITAVNSRGLWAGATQDEGGTIRYHWLTENPQSVDGAIQCAAGGQYHMQAQILIGAPEGTTVVTRRQVPHKGAFDDVVFVVDDQQIPLYDLLMSALTAADDAGLRSVSVPALRTGVMSSKGGSWSQKINELARAACDFRPRARNLRQIIFVIHQDSEIVKTLQSTLAPAPATPGSIPRVKVQIGDITRVPSDGLITALNSEGMWGGGIDRAIASVAGSQYHRLAGILIGKPEGMTLVARGQHPHAGAFRNVVFVVDDVGLPLYDILVAGLKAADEAGLTTVSIPAMRMGVMMDLGGAPEEKIADMARAVRDFQKGAANVKSVNFVIYGDPITAEALQQALARIPE